MPTQPDMVIRVGKPSVWVTVFSVFSAILGKTMAKPFVANLLRGSRMAIITAFEPGQHMCFKTLEV